LWGGVFWRVCVVGCLGVCFFCLFAWFGGVVVGCLVVFWYFGYSGLGVVGLLVGAVCFMVWLFGGVFLSVGGMVWRRGGSVGSVFVLIGGQGGYYGAGPRCRPPVSSLGPRPPPGTYSLLLRRSALGWVLRAGVVLGGSAPFLCCGGARLACPSSDIRWLFFVFIWVGPLMAASAGWRFHVARSGQFAACARRVGRPPKPLWEWTGRHTPAYCSVGSVPVPRLGGCYVGVMAFMAGASVVSFFFW